MDFSNVIELKIPEGDVAEIQIDSQTVWTKPQYNFQIN